jgi:hypothetical protein
VAYIVFYFILLFIVILCPFGQGFKHIWFCVNYTYVLHSICFFMQFALFDICFFVCFLYTCFLYTHAFAYISLYAFYALVLLHTFLFHFFFFFFKEAWYGRPRSSFNMIFSRRPNLRYSLGCFILHLSFNLQV